MHAGFCKQLFAAGIGGTRQRDEEYLSVYGILLSAGSIAGQPAQVQAAVGLNHTSAVICIGGRVELKLNGTDEPVTWTTSNKKIATVGSAGVVTGVNKGKASITAQAGGKKYSCLVTVNETYGASVSSVTIKRQETVMLTFTKDAVVSYKIKDTDICSASWGSWDGNEIPLLITPKKVGTTYITCSNGANNETVRIRVKVKKVPVNVTDIQAVTSDGGGFVCGENTLQISFKQDRTSRNTVLYIIGRNGETVSTMKLGVVPARRTYYTFWDGKNDLGVNFEGEFRIKIVADGYTVRKWHYYESYASSPFAGGDGTKERPYQVATAGHLLKMPDFNGRHFIQVRDIDLRSEIIGSLSAAAIMQSRTRLITGFCILTAIHRCLEPSGQKESLTMSSLWMRVSREPGRSVPQCWQRSISGR